MKVFISWSGEPSRSIAVALRRWLPLVVQHVKPWMSDEEIASGTRWNDEIARSLEDTDFGIVCVTASNQHQPWLMFEAGALAKRLQTARVVPLLIDLSPAEVTGPLVAFQGRRLDQGGMHKLIRDISAVRDEPLADDQVVTLFNALWPKLEEQIEQAKAQAPKSDSPRRNDEDMLEELVERVRRIERRQPPLPPTSVAPGDIVWFADRKLVIRNDEDVQRAEELLDLARLLGYPMSAKIGAVQQEASEEPGAERSHASEPED